MAQMVNNLPAMQETWVQSLGQEDPLEKETATHSSVLAWEFQGQRSLASYSPWGREETWLSNFHFTLVSSIPAAGRIGPSVLKEESRQHTFCVMG